MESAIGLAIVGCILYLYQCIREGAEAQRKGQKRQEEISRKERRRANANANLRF